MAGTRVNAPTLPYELWLYIHRLAVSDISPVARDCVQDEAVKYSGRPDHPLNDQDLQRFLKAARSLGRVCRLWAELAQELLYENIWVNDSKRWPSLSKALLQPDRAGLVRNIRLSPTRFDHNAFILHHCAPHIQVLVQPEFPRIERLYAADLDFPLSPLPSLTRVYWIESTWSVPLLRAVLAAAPNIKHLTLSSSSSIGSGLYSAIPPVFPALSCLESLVLLPLTPLCVHTLLNDAKLIRLTHLTIAPVQLEWDAFPVLRTLRTLTLVEYPSYTRARVPFPSLLPHFPCLEELRYSAHLPAVAPVEKQTASTLTCVRLYLGAEALPPMLLTELPAHRNAMLLLGPAFGALENVVLDGPGWAGNLEWDEWVQLRARGCMVVRGAGGEMETKRCAGERRVN
ncbi:hypothetical protein K438DRAFT_1795317 [Mycena galopus ATCC 62051]|nr:hypothetical protein K438DRAFT_1795317 [Mycena galopus ATCC 62051]